MKPGDVAVCLFPGTEAAKTRPAVVLSTALYQQHRPDVIVGLITTQVPKVLSPTDCLLLDWKQAGLHAPSYFRLFLVTIPQRDARMVGRLSEADWASVRQCFAAGLAI